MKIRIIFAALVAVLLSSGLSDTAGATPWRGGYSRRCYVRRPFVRVYVPAPPRVYVPPVPVPVPGPFVAGRHYEHYRRPYPGYYHWHYRDCGHHRHRYYDR